MLEAKLVYIVDGERIELERMELEELDEFTYNGFSSEEDIFRMPRYYNKLCKLPQNGEFKIVFSGDDVPISSLDYFTAFGKNPFDGEQELDVLVSKRKIAPSVRSFRRNIAMTLRSSSIVEEFYSVFEDSFTAKEKFAFRSGLINQNIDDIFLGIKRIIAEATVGADGYLIGRIFLDGLGNFKSVKNKDKKGRLCSVKALQKK